jgi:hypothetical protein
MAFFEISDMHVLTGWIVIVGGAYIMLHLKRIRKKTKEQRQPKYCKDRSDKSL